LHETLCHLEVRGRQRASMCPNMSYYLADLIANKGTKTRWGLPPVRLWHAGLTGTGNSPRRRGRWPAQPLERQVKLAEWKLRPRFAF
jgi:hypothetical protein